MEKLPTLILNPLFSKPCCCNCCITHAFQTTSSLHPQKTAIIHASSPSPTSSVSYTFSELQSAISALSHRLITTLPSRRVAIWMSPSVEYLVSLLSVLKAGGMFIPLDPSWPIGRLETVLRSVEPDVVLASRHALGFVGEKKKKKIIDVLEEEGANCEVWWLGEGFAKGLGNSGSEEDKDCGCGRRQGRRGFCYVLFTSGSSGAPKGVCGTEEGLLNRLSWMESTYPHVSTDVGCFKTSVGFVDHLTEALGPLLAGIPLVIPPPEILKGNLLSLLNYIEAYKITRLTAVPSIFRALLPALQSSRQHASGSLRILVLSGEPLSLKLLEELHSILRNHTTILNLYGSTEVSGDSSYFNCTTLSSPSSTLFQFLKQYNLSSTPIGTPISNCHHFIIVNNNKLAGVNEEGELWVGGIGVANSYLNDEDNSPQRKFIDLSHLDEALDSFLLLKKLREILHPYGRIFRTGDIAKELPDGNVVVLGRMDRQVKIRGNRVSLEEIEATIETHPKVSGCVTRVDSETNLVAYVVCKHTNSLEECFFVKNDKNVKSGNFVHRAVNEEDFVVLSNELKAWLEERLPSVMVPQIYVPLEALPLNDSGKVDFSALPDLIRSLDDGNNLISNSAREEEGLPGIDLVRQVFARVLKVEKLSNDDDFFSRGGTSISAAHAAHILDIDMRLLYMYPSASLLFNAIGDSNSKTKIKIILGDLLNTQNQGKLSAFSNTEILNGMTASETLNPEPKPNSVGGDHQTLLSQKRKHEEIGAVSRQEEHNWRWDSSAFSGVSVGLLRCNRIVDLHSSWVKDLPSTLERNAILQSGLPKEESRSIQLCWKVSLQACVDASPLVVLHGDVLRVFIGSHSHNFLSLDAISGELQWEATLGGRVESSAAVTADASQVVVGCYDGFIYFFDFWNGRKLWSFKTAGEVKCQPALDPWTGLIWCGSHDHHLYALDPISQTCRWRHDCGGSIFGSPAFNESRETVYVGTTRGTIIAIQIQPTIHVVWTYEYGAPIFGSLAVDSSTEYVICASVSGGVTALKPDGLPAWQANTDGPIFAGATISSALVSQVLVSSGDSHLHCLNLEDGSIVWKHNVGGPITSSAYVEEDPVFLFQADCNNNDHHVAERLMCVASTSGTVQILCAPTAITSRSSSIIPNERGHHSDVPQQSPPLSSSSTNNNNNNRLAPIQVVSQMELPGEVFSSPVMIRGRVFVGCRDNFLYCLESV